MTVFMKRADQFTEADIDNEIVIMRLDSGEFYSLSGTAAWIWRLIDGNLDRRGLVLAAVEEFDGAEHQIHSDIDELLKQLEEAGLLANG